MIKNFVLVFSTIFLFHSVSQATDISRVNVSSTGIQSNAFSFYKAISADGRYVAFQSSANNLVEGDTNGYDDIFVHDTQTGTTELVSVSSTGEQGDFDAGTTSISADGRYVAFSSGASNLVASNAFGVFIHDRQTGITELVGVSSDGRPGLYGSSEPSLSADGRFVAFQSFSPDLVDNDTNEWDDIFVHDRLNGTTELVSRSTTGLQADNASLAPTISADGRYVAFHSEGLNLAPGNSSLYADVYVHDRLTSTTKRVSVSSTGEQGNSYSEVASISADGRVVFYSLSSNLVKGDTNQSIDIFMHHLESGVTELISVSSAGEQGNFDSVLSTISADGRYVTYTSSATNLVTGDINNRDDIFVHDRQSGMTELVSVSSTGEQGNELSAAPVISANGNAIVFFSRSSNLVDSDTNNHDDIFVTENPLKSTPNGNVMVEKLINNTARETRADAAQLLTGTQYRQAYQVTNNSPNRLYQVKVFEDGNLVCNLYSLNPGETKQRCGSYQLVVDGDQDVEVMVTAKASGSSDVLTNTTNAHYKGRSNPIRRLSVTHYIDNSNADRENQAPTLGDPVAEVLFKVENIGQIELYRVKAYHDPVSPVNSGWEEYCLIGILKPGQIRYCKRPGNFTDAGLNHAVGRVQGADAIISPTEIVNAGNSTYFIAP